MRIYKSTDGETFYWVDIHTRKSTLPVPDVCFSRAVAQPVGLAVGSKE